MGKIRREKENGEDKDTQKALLNNSNHTPFVAFSKNNAASKEKKEKKSAEAEGMSLDEKKKKNKSVWTGMINKCRLLWPFMWPKGDLMLQIRVIVCIVIVLATRGVTVLVPIYYKKIVNSLTIQAVPIDENSLAVEKNDSALYSPPAGLVNAAGLTLDLRGTELPESLEPVYVEKPRFCWDYILIFILLKSLHGGNGYLNCLRSFLWISVSQNTRKRMRLELFTHLHSLSVQWHLQRKTGEVLRVMDRGVNSINLILSHVLFNIAPVIADIIIAIVFFITLFNIWTGLIVLGTMVGYLVFTIVISEWRTKYRRMMNETDNARNATSVDSILNFETVKYYSAEDWEVKCYEQSVDKHLGAEWSVNATANLLNCIQRGMMMMGLLGGSMLLAWNVHTGILTLGDFVLFLSYVEQLYGPLNMFGAYYRTLQQAFVDMENMFEMLEEEVQVKDDDDAQALQVTHGQIEFEDVIFAYNPVKPILRGISFSIPAGHTYALVGHSGGGKSTIIRLLFRFYDIQSGVIRIDGQDIAKVTQKSLRTQVGVVPQDTVLFNKDIRYNIRYGRHDAPDEDVEDAARAGDIHDRIINIPGGYDARVGERGLKLSGGEKQRIAIARTILKSPKIVLLDEATSALDTKTERNIQESLSDVCKGRTTVIVAHRLSTIIHADQILVIEEGQIVEQGTHDDLLDIGGIYCEMWHDQLQSGEIGEDIEACACCPDGIHEEGDETEEDEMEEEEEEEGRHMEDLVQREIKEADEPPEDGKDEVESGTQMEDIDKPNRNSRVLFAIEGDNSNELKIIEEDDDCKCPCHIQKELIEEIKANNSGSLPSRMFSRQISAQGMSLEELPGEVIGPDVFGTEGSGGYGTVDQCVQVQVTDDEEDYDDLFHHHRHHHQQAPYGTNPRYVSPKKGGRNIARTTSMSERPRPRSIFERPLSTYERYRDGRDRARTVSTGDELGSSSSSRVLRRQLSRQQSCAHARCKAREVRERQISRDRDRDNANRLSVKDHEHFSVSIDDLNAATDQYFKDSEDNSALKTTIVTPTQEEENKYPTVADVIKENNRHSLRNSMEVTINVEEM